MNSDYELPKNSITKSRIAIEVILAVVVFLTTKLPAVVFYLIPFEFMSAGSLFFVTQYILVALSWIAFFYYVVIRILALLEIKRTISEQ